ncbi:hypothetical protein SLEP1_g2707 [Rubroshorea leprosula]|uniref:Scarecrow-like protein 6 n=1 Tax=Rubroshorea leprosula TaxID=152421 RepID=A0AAV5HS79_9ROSI|nr:hypothetical protein SLEP1_g2707 [Rubroshorea leprosula]
MKAMPFPFEEFQGKGVLDFSSSSSSCSDSSLLPLQQQQEQLYKWLSKGGEPTSVLDLGKSPSPPTSSSTLSSSRGGSSGGGSGASTSTTGTATVVSGNHPVDIGREKCGMGMEDWEGVFSGSPSQEQSILRLIMGDVEDPSMGLSKILQPGMGSQEVEFNAGFGMVDQGFSFESFSSSGNLVGSVEPSLSGSFSDFARMGSVANPINPIPASSPGNLLPASLPPGGGFQQQQQLPHDALDEKPQIFNPQLIINPNQAQFTQNPAMFLPMPYAQLQEHHLLSPPPPKRLNSGSGGSNYQVPKVPFLGSDQQELYLRRQQQQQQQLQMLQQRPTTMGMPTAKPKMVSDEFASQQLQRAIIDQVFKAAELIETGNPVLAQVILARLNHQLSSVGNPFQRAAFYFKEALQLLLHMDASTASAAFSSYSMILKIGAYKSFSEISPIVQFANFTCNQALLEAFEGFDRIHIIDFDIGYGGQWASLMQELALRNGGAPSLKITAFASPATHEEFELGFTQENLKHFASEINMLFDIEIVRLESLNPASWRLNLQAPESEAIAVNLPISSFSNYPSTLPLVLRFVKQLSPKIVVSLDRGCDRADVPFAHHVIHALQSYSDLIESLDAVNMNIDALQKIERFLLQPSIEKIVLGRHRFLQRTAPWRNVFMQSGFSPLAFSNFTESQADCLVQRTPVRGFHVEKRQSSLVLCWQSRELIAASAWRC